MAKKIVPESAFIHTTCVDTHVLSKHWKQCQIWEIRKGTPDYSSWKDYHVFSGNHTASSGAMEVAGATEIFRRSIEKKNLICPKYLEDGDTSFKVDSNS